MELPDCYPVRFGDIPAPHEPPMALDLFLVPYKPKSRAKGALRKSRETLLEALQKAYSGTVLVGDAMAGYVADFPLGELHIRPDELHWTLHGVDDPAPVHALADWFFTQGFACRDPQGAGFDRPLKAAPAVRGQLEDLIGGQWLGFRFDRNYATALDFDFLLADDRVAVLRLLYFASGRVPDLQPLIEATVIGVAFKPDGAYKTLTVRFDSGHDLVFVDAVFDSVRIR